MKASSVFRSPLFVKGADIGTTKTLAEADLNKCHQVTAGVVVTIPTPLTMKAQAGDMVMLFNSSAAGASVALGAGASFLNHSGSVPLTPGVAVLLVAYSDSAWTIQGIVPATQADIVAGTDVKKFVNAKEHLSFHQADITKLAGIAAGANLYVHPNHSGDVTSVADGAQTIAANAVTNAKLADMANGTIKGRKTAGLGDPEDLSINDLRGLLNISNRNKIINGNFDIWQRGTSQTASGYGSADRWRSDLVGSSNTMSRQSFSTGQTEVSGNPAYFLRNTVASATGSANYATVVQKIESVCTLAGKKATLSFWAKSDANKSIAIELAQVFGTGGSPSSPVFGLASQLVALTTSWKKYAITIDVPSILGKTLGTNGNDSLQVLFWFDAGSNFASRTSNLGQQSGTFDIAQVQLEEGEIATPFEQRHIADELALCQRYYQKGNVSTRGYLPASHFMSHSVNFCTPMRVAPSLTLTAGSRSNTTSVAVSSITSSDFRQEIVASANGDAYALGELWKADAEL